MVGFVLFQHFFPAIYCSVYCSIDPAQLAQLHLSRAEVTSSSRLLCLARGSVQANIWWIIWRLPRLHHAILLRDEFRIFAQSRKMATVIVKNLVRQRKLVKTFVLRRHLFRYWRYSASVVAPIICNFRERWLTRVRLRYSSANHGVNFIDKKNNLIEAACTTSF